MDHLVSYIAYSIRESGLASSYDCRAEKNRLLLIMIGPDTVKLRKELETYLQLMKLPANSTLAIFTGAAPQPVEIDLN